MDTPRLAPGTVCYVHWSPWLGDDWAWIAGEIVQAVRLCGIHAVTGPDGVSIPFHPCWLVVTDSQREVCIAEYLLEPIEPAGDVSHTDIGLPDRAGC